MISFVEKSSYIVVCWLVAVQMPLIFIHFYFMRHFVLSTRSVELVELYRTIRNSTAQHHRPYTVFENVQRSAVARKKVNSIFYYPHSDVDLPATVVLLSK